MRSALGFLGMTVATMVGCGGGAPPARPAEVAVHTVARDEAVDRSPVPAPDTLLVFGRVAKPAQLVQVVGGWTGLPLGANVLGELAADAPLGNAADYTQPLDFGVAFDVQRRSVMPGLGISVAVRSLEEAKRALAPNFKVTPLKGGVYSLEPKDPPAQGDEDEDRDRRYCGLYPANGSPYRLVCSTSASSLAALAPYLARTAPRNTYPSDLHVEATLAPYQSVLNQGRGMLPGMVTGFLGLKKAGNAATADMLSAAIGDLVDFAIDIDRVTFDANVSEAQGDATVTASFKSAQSLTARLATAHPERTEVVPPSFWRLPVATEMAYFHRGVDEKDIAHARDLSLDAFGKELKEQGASDADKKAVLDALSHTVSLLIAPSVMAKGVDWEAVQKSVQNAKAQDAKSATDAKMTVLEQSAGWSLAGLEVPLDKVQAMVSEYGALFARPGVVKWLKASGKKVSAMSLRAVPARAGAVPKGSLHYELSVTRTGEPPPPPAPAPEKRGEKKTAEKKTAEKPVKVHLYLVPDSSRTWIAMAIDDALAQKTIAKLTANDASGSLEKREGLEVLRQAKVGAAGFISMRGFLQGSPIAFATEAHEFRDPFHGLRAAPAQGATPIPFTLTSQAGKDGAAGSLILTARVPKAAIQDIVISTTGGMRP